jgi:hypothetical protein
MIKVSRLFNFTHGYLRVTQIAHIEQFSFKFTMWYGFAIAHTEKKSWHWQVQAAGKQGKCSTDMIIEPLFHLITNIYSSSSNENKYNIKNLCGYGLDLQNKTKIWVLVALYNAYTQCDSFCSTRIVGYFLPTFELDKTLLPVLLIILDLRGCRRLLLELALGPSNRSRYSFSSSFRWLDTWK